MEKTIEIVLSVEAETQLEKAEYNIKSAFFHKIEYLRKNIHHGNPIRKSLIPERYKELYGLKNLFRIELPKYYRFLYTLTNNDTHMKIIVLILEILSHEEYDKRFGYRKK